MVPNSGIFECKMFPVYFGNPINLFKCRINQHIDIIMYIMHLKITMSTISMNWQRLQINWVFGIVYGISIKASNKVKLITYRPSMRKIRNM